MTRREGEARAAERTKPKLACPRSHWRPENGLSSGGIMVSPAVSLPHLAFATPRKLPKASELPGRVVVLDIAFASEASGGGFAKITKPFIDGVGDRLARWVDHHDHRLHGTFAEDRRFVLATKKQHGACPEMITPELVAATGAIDTIVCHGDFDGLVSAAKWIRGGHEPYPGADDDARAIDTRIGKPGPKGLRLDRALRARSRDASIFGLIIRVLTSDSPDPALWAILDEAAREMEALEAATDRLAAGYTRISLPSASVARSIAFLRVPTGAPRYDKTGLLLAGQDRAAIAAVIDKDTLTLAAPFDSGIDFLELLGLSGGMPTVVSVPIARLDDALRALRVPHDERYRFEA